jgi:trigger factor
MELKNVEKLEHSQVKLTISISAEELDKGKETAYKKNRSKLQVPGFRKGKAPRKMIEKLYGVRSGCRRGKACCCRPRRSFFC